MGHAVYIGLKKVNSIYSAVIWADQIFLSSITIKKTIKKFLDKKLFFLFQFKKKKIHIRMLFLIKKQFKDIIQKEKQIKCQKLDIQIVVFLYSILKNKKSTLDFCIKKKLIITKNTKEVDFLKSFKFISKKGKFELLKTNYKRDSVGVNYIEDLNL